MTPQAELEQNDKVLNDKSAKKSHYTEPRRELASRVIEVLSEPKFVAAPITMINDRDSGITQSRSSRAGSMYEQPIHLQLNENKKPHAELTVTHKDTSKMQMENFSSAKNEEVLEALANKAQLEVQVTAMNVAIADLRRDHVTSLDQMKVFYQEQMN